MEHKRRASQLIGSFPSPDKANNDHEGDDDLNRVWQEIQLQKQGRAVEQEQDNEETWETESFKEWKDMNWAMFYYEFNDSFYNFPKEHFKDSESPRSSGRRNPLKPGYFGMRTEDPNSSRFHPKQGKIAAQFAVDFYNGRNKGKNSIQLDRVCKVNRCLRYPSRCIYFLTFQTIDNAGARKTFQASVAESYGQADILMRVRAFRPKPCTDPS